MARGLLGLAIATGLAGAAGAALLKRQTKNKKARAVTHASKSPTKSAEPSKKSQPSRGAKSKSRRAAAAGKRAGR
jgi:hypothetical protein